MNLSVAVLVIAIAFGIPFIFLGIRRNNKRMIINGFIIIITGALHYFIISKA